MDLTTARRLLDLNRDFYRRFGADFSATRQRLQPGVTRLLGTLSGGESILDLGCGNGELARALARRGHRGPYLGLDFSPPLLSDASVIPNSFLARFIEADITSAWAVNVEQSTFNVVTCFATLHHIPSKELRLNILKTVRNLLAPEGRFILSNWQFRNSDKLRGRVQPWERIGLSVRDVDADDYLLDWRRGGEGLRYIHQFSQAELAELADSTGFRVQESFYSDGQGGKLGLYQVWSRGIISI